MTALDTATAPSTSTGKGARRPNGAKAPQMSKSAKTKDSETKKAKAASAASTPAAELSALAQGARDLLVPLEKLVLSEANVRRAFQAEGIEELAALLESQGQLQRLAVVAHTDDTYAVVAGGRRLRAMQRLVAKGKWEASRPVECKLFDSERAAEVSLAENSGREAMHPADEMEAFQGLVAQGLSVPQVADRFGVSALTVERRLKLARLAPRFLDMYRADQIEPEQLQALALTEDHAAQEAAWDGLPVYNRDAWSLRRVLTEQSCEGGSRLARFVGVEAYEARGGVVRRDLFADDNMGCGVYLDDSVLLQTLAMEKLWAAAEEVRTEGWGWVDCLIEGDSLALRGYGREPESERAPTPEEAQSIAAMEAERDELDTAYRENELADRDSEAYEAEDAFVGEKPRGRIALGRFTGVDHHEHFHTAPLCITQCRRPRLAGERVRSHVERRSGRSNGVNHERQGVARRECRRDVGRRGCALSGWRARGRCAPLRRLGCHRRAEQECKCQRQSGPRGTSFCQRWQGEPCVGRIRSAHGSAPRVRARRAGGCGVACVSVHWPADGCPDLVPALRPAGHESRALAHAFDAALLPFELVLPDLEAGVAQVVAALHQRFDGAVVGAVKCVV